MSRNIRKQYSYKEKKLLIANIHDNSKILTFPLKKILNDPIHSDIFLILIMTLLKTISLNLRML